MRILFVAMVGSIHTARWINQISSQGYDIHIFPSYYSGVHPELKNATVHDRPVRSAFADISVKQRYSLPWPFQSSADLANKVFCRLRHVELARFSVPQHQRLARLIDKLKPDIIHSHEMQAAGYLTLDARKNCRSEFPPWIMSIWGSDLFLFSRLDDHVNKIKNVLSLCDYLGSECQRDISLAKSLGFKNEMLPCLPMFGGFQLDKLVKLREPGPISGRKLIVLKGYHGWAGRSLVGLRALELCAEKLKGYKVVIPMADASVKLASELFTSKTGIPTEIIPPCSNEDILKIYGRARLSIGLSISDGLPASFAESLVMGSFPIQSCTACANEWIEDGKSGLIVPPEDPEPIAEAIRLALTDNKLVNGAAVLNMSMAQERLDFQLIQPKVIEIYENIIKGRN